MELISAEKKRLDELEVIIEKNIVGFYATGMALTEIRENRLYKEKGYDEFEMYCKYEWDMGRRYANRLIASSDVVINIAQNGANWPQTEPDFITNIDKKTIILPKNEYQARPLTKFNPEKQISVWQKVLLAAGDGRITAAMVARIAGETRDQEVEETIKSLKKRISTEERVSPPFKKNYKIFLDALWDARQEDWAETSKKAAIKYVEVLKELITEDLDKITITAKEISKACVGR